MLVGHTRCSHGDNYRVVRISRKIRAVGRQQLQLHFHKCGGSGIILHLHTQEEGADEPSGVMVALVFPAAVRARLMVRPSEEKPVAYTKDHTVNASPVVITTATYVGQPQLLWRIVGHSPNGATPLRVLM